MAESLESLDHLYRNDHNVHQQTKFKIIKTYFQQHQHENVQREYTSRMDAAFKQSMRESMRQLYGIELNDSQLAFLIHMRSKSVDVTTTAKELECYQNHWHAYHDSVDVMCFPYYDGIQCWPPTLANRTVKLLCPVDISFIKNITISHHCTSSGTWENSEFGVPYTTCFEDSIAHLFEKTDNSTNVAIGLLTSTPFDENSKFIYQPGIWKNYCPLQLTSGNLHHNNTQIDFDNFLFIYENLSISLLVICLLCQLLSCASFYSFRKLRHHRLAVHRNIIISYVLRFVCAIAHSVLALQHDLYLSNLDWLCKFLKILTQYGVLGNIFWLLVEIIVLHNRVVESTFSNEAPVLVLNALGWGIPLIILGAYSGTVAIRFKNSFCWSHGEFHYIIIVLVPLTVAYILSGILFGNVIRVYFTRLRSSRSSEMTKLRKCILNVLITFPLLGTASVLQQIHPFKLCSSGDVTWRLLALFVEFLQGILIPVLYCFTSSEMSQEIRVRWLRYKLRRLNGQNIISGLFDTGVHEKRAADGSRCRPDGAAIPLVRLRFITKRRPNRREQNMIINSDLMQPIISSQRSSATFSENELRRKTISSSCSMTYPICNAASNGAAETSMEPLLFQKNAHSLMKEDFTSDTSLTQNIIIHENFEGGKDLKRQSSQTRSNRNNFYSTPFLDTQFSYPQSSKIKLLTSTANFHPHERKRNAFSYNSTDVLSSNESFVT